MRVIKSFEKDDVVGIEAKHITYIADPNGSQHDLHVVKEIVHLKDKSQVPRIRFVEDYKRPFYVTNKGQQNHKEKKDYEFVKNLTKYQTTQVSMASAISRILGDYSGRPYLKQLARSPYLYGTDVSSSSCLKNDYRQAYPGLSSPNTGAGGDIETNVYESDKDGQIICMSVTHKTQVYLAYLKDWVSDLEDPIQETHDELSRIPELVRLKEKRNLNIVIEVVDSPVDIIRNCIGKLHEWKVDFFSFWNINFDMTRILDTLAHHGVDPKDIFSDPNVPPRYRYFHYKQDKPLNISAGGVSKSKSPADEWHWVTEPASFQCIDAMSTYRLARLAGGKDSSYALDYILAKELSMDVESLITTQKDLDKLNSNLERRLRDTPEAFPYFYISNPDEDVIRTIEVPSGNYDELGNEIIDTHELRDPQWKPVEHLTLGDTIKPGQRGRIDLSFGKLSFPEVDHLMGIEWHKEMQTKHKVRYGLYNIIDSLRLEQLDEKTNDLARSISLYSKNSDYQDFNSNPKRLCTDMHFWYLDQAEPKVIGSSSDEMVHELDGDVISHSGWIITLPTYMAVPNGISTVKDLPGYKTLHRHHEADLDIISTYPRVSQLLNIGRETTVMEFSRIKGVSEHHRREVGVNLTGGRVNALEICQKILKAPTLDQMLHKYLEAKGVTVPKLQ